MPLRSGRRGWIVRIVLGGCLILAAGCAAKGKASSPAFTPLVPLASTEPCSRCAGWLLPGALEPSPRTDYRIDSDLPEIFTSNGVLYSTRAILPPFCTVTGDPVPETMRTQRNAGFHSIDGSFEVFLYHLSRKHAPGETRRVVVYAHNLGAAAVVVRPRQVLLEGPNAGNAQSVESRLGEAVLREKWDRPLGEVRIEPGEGAIVGFSRQLGAAEESVDATKQVFVNGVVRADVEGHDGAAARLEVAVLSIPGAGHDLMLAAAQELLDVGADSGEDAMDLLTPPPECHVRRVGGTARNALWRSAPVRFDVARLPAGGVFFPMASFAVQTAGCDESRQSADMLLYPPYVHSDSVGNYMMEYLVTLTLANTGDAARTVDVMFGKTDAPVGLAWQLAVGREPAALGDLEPLPVSIAWAGKRRVGEEDAPWYRATFLRDGPLALEPDGETTVSLRLMVLGTSSLPWQLHVVAR